MARLIPTNGSPSARSGRSPPRGGRGHRHLHGLSRARRVPGAVAAALDHRPARRLGRPRRGRPGRTAPPMARLPARIRPRPVHPRSHLGRTPATSHAAPTGRPATTAGTSRRALSRIRAVRMARAMLKHLTAAAPPARDQAPPGGRSIPPATLGPAVGGGTGQADAGGERRGCCAASLCPAPCHHGRARRGTIRRGLWHNGRALAPPRAPERSWPPRAHPLAAR